MENKSWVVVGKDRGRISSKIESLICLFQSFNSHSNSVCLWNCCLLDFLMNIVFCTHTRFVVSFLRNSFTTRLSLRPQRRHDYVRAEFPILHTAVWELLAYVHCRTLIVVMYISDKVFTIAPYSTWDDNDCGR